MAPRTGNAGETRLDALRADMRAHFITDEAKAVGRMAAMAKLTREERDGIVIRGAELVRRVRKSSDPKLMEAFLAEYGLSTKEGVALMCLAEALLRVPDTETIDDLIRDKITPHDWSAHSGASGSVFVNASTWALMLTGQVLDEQGEGIEATLRGLVRRMGEPVIRRAVATAMREMGDNFVLGRTIKEALKRGRDEVAKGYSYSFDMLGEAARTHADAERYFAAYENAIAAIALEAKSDDIRANPGISVKLSALHPRYESTQKVAMIDTLAGRLLRLCQMAKASRIGLNIDAEEADRLDLSLDVIEAVLSDKSLAGWDGFGVVVQAYGPRAPFVIDWLNALAERLDRRIMVRLVKGAYWDAEIKRAQAMGLTGFPVYTRKVHTDISYMGCARKLFGYTDRIYPQFATHNAHTAAAILAMAGNDRQSFEFQRLHGMGDALHGDILRGEGTRCRIYAPVGAHEDLLAYLVRRLLENGANSSFVHQIVDEDVAPETIARDPFAAVEEEGARPSGAIRTPDALFAPERGNSRGYDLNDPVMRTALDKARTPFAAPHQWKAGPLVAGLKAKAKRPVRMLLNPARVAETVGIVAEATADDAATAVAAAVKAQPGWAKVPVAKRAAMLNKAADLYENHLGEFLALATREAGKTVADGIAEVREAVDFLRYYAAQAAGAERGTQARGAIVCISPWNFPLAIFTGQIAAALATGNTVLAKPAEQTPLIAHKAVTLLREAGIPEAVLQLLPGDGPSVGATLTSDKRIAGVCFTGSTEVARLIERALAENAAPDAMLIAETGGLNAMIVDSTALPEQAVRDALASAFQSAGQRCSALRILYVQKDIEARVTAMLKGAMEALTVGDPGDYATDTGPLIDDEALGALGAYCKAAEKEGRVIAKLDTPKGGRFMPPHILKVKGIAEMEREIFGPVLHVATFKADQLDAVIEAVNARGYGLTFGLHTRIDARVQHIVNRVHAGNIYVNRNQIGAVVGSQPFGGEGLSGTGPKAGGPHYLRRFRKSVAPHPHLLPASGEKGSPASRLSPNGNRAGSYGARPASQARAQTAVQPSSPRLRGEDAGRQMRGETSPLGQALATLSTMTPLTADPVGALRKALRGKAAEALAAAAAIDPGPVDLPGPTGEANTLMLAPRGTVLCLGPGADAALDQAVQALSFGNRVVMVAPDAAKIVQPLARAGFAVVEQDEALSPSPLWGRSERSEGVGVEESSLRPPPRTIASLRSDPPHKGEGGAPMFDAVAFCGDAATMREIRQSLAVLSGPIVPLIAERIYPAAYAHERSVCVDTTAAGGNASLLAEAG